MVLTVNREMIHFVIIDKYVFYRDKKTQSYIRCLPKPEKLLEMQKKLERLFTFTEGELKEYEGYQTEEEIAKAVIRDAALKSCRLLIKKEVPTTEEVRILIKDKEVLVI
jgi:hypothetical protein